MKKNGKWIIGTVLASIMAGVMVRNCQTHERRQELQDRPHVSALLVTTQPYFIVHRDSMWSQIKVQVSNVGTGSAENCEVVAVVNSQPEAAFRRWRVPPECTPISVRVVLGGSDVPRKELRFQWKAPIPGKGDTLYMHIATKYRGSLTGKTYHSEHVYSLRVSGMSETTPGLPAVKTELVRDTTFEH